MTGTSLLKAENLSKYFTIATRDGLTELKAVDGVSFDIARNRSLSIVGESGSGKSTVCRMLLLLEQPTSGNIVYDGQEVLHASKSWISGYRKKVQAVFQDPYSSLNPRMKVWEIVCESLLANGMASKAEALELSQELLMRVGLPETANRQFPHEFSGGQRQRIALARSLACSPELVILDEAVSALDVSVRAQILNLLDDLRAELGVTYVMVTHDIDVAAHVSDDIAVMYFGQLVEHGSAEAICQDPKHPYTKLLMQSVLTLSKTSLSNDQLTAAAGRPDDQGCVFRSRCSFAKPECAVEAPKPRDVFGHGTVACHLY